MFKVLVSDPISDLGIQQLMDAADVQVEKKTGLGEDELAAIIGEYDALLVRSQTRVTEKIMEAGTKLKVVGRAGCRRGQHRPGSGNQTRHYRH